MGAEYVKGDYQTPMSVLDKDDEDQCLEASTNSEVHAHSEEDNLEVKDCRTAA